MPQVSVALAGRCILVTRPVAQAGHLEHLLRAAGADPLALPLFRIEPTAAREAHSAALAAARHWDGWLFTSVNAARLAAALDAGPWPPLYAIGSATAHALAALGHPGAREAPQGSTSEDLLRHEALREVRGARFLVVTGEGGRDLLGQTLRDRGARVQRLELYRRAPIDHSPDTLRGALQQVDAIICTSGQGVERLQQLTPADARGLLYARMLVVPSPRVLELARRLGFSDVRAPAAMSDEALVGCLSC